MRTRNLTLLFALALIGLSSAVNGQDAAVRAILDSNGLYDVDVNDVVTRNYRGHVDTLDLRGRGISTVPAEIGALYYLKVLLLSNNKIQTLPPQIGSAGSSFWGQFTLIDLSNNLLVSLPDEFMEVETELEGRFINVKGNFLCGAVSQEMASFLNGRAESSWESLQNCTEPVIRLNGGVLSTPLSFEIKDPGAYAFDALDGDLTSQINVSGNVDVNTLGEYYLTYTVENSSMVSSEIRRTVNVVKDSVAPVFDLGGDTVSIWELRPYIETATASDEIDGDVTSRIVVEGEVDSSRVGIHVLKFTVTDRSMNESTARKYVVVKEDVSPPRVYLQGETELYLEVYGSFIERGYTARDLPGEDLTSKVEITTDLDTTKAGTYTVNYTVTDIGGNTSEVAARTVHVFESGTVNQLIRVNQLGYLPEGPKLATYSSAMPDSFYIVNEESNEIVYRSVLSPSERCSHSGEDYVRQADFSDVTTPGVYYLQVKGAGRSPVFRISANIYEEAFKASLKAFYYQRASMALEEEHAGEYSRQAGHPDNECPYYLTSGDGNALSAPGGWYDAGDYGKYVVNAGITVWTLLAFHELFPEAVPDNYLNIPESGNGKSDLLDEVKYELDWLKTMQAADGGVYFKVAGMEFPGFIMPHEDTQTRYVIGKSTTSALNFSAVMAMAGRIYRDYDSTYAADCLDRAINAYEWAKLNPSVLHPKTEGGSGLYDDTDFGDEFRWAATELYITTGSEAYWDDIGSIGANYHPASWQDVTNLSAYSLISHGLSPERGIGGVQGLARKCMDGSRDDLYSLPDAYYCYWGSNSVILNSLVNTIYASVEQGQDSLHNSVFRSIDYFFGRNPLNKCYVTGFGYNPPMFPHHRVSGGDLIEVPVPGFLVGGSNYRQEDSRDEKEPVTYTYSGMSNSYMDVQASYASNEVAINWNAPLVFVLGFLNETYGDPSEPPLTNISTASKSVRKQIGLESVKRVGSALQIRCALNASKPVAISLYDLQGRKVVSSVHKKTRKGINVLSVKSERPLARGFYILEISSGPEKLVTRFWSVK